VVEVVELEGVDEVVGVVVVVAASAILAAAIGERLSMNAQTAVRGRSFLE
jgi:hypothetical protein